MRRRLEFLLTVCCFVALTLSPWIAGALGVRASETTENRPLLASPDLSLDRSLDSAQFAELEEFVIDHLPLRQQSAAAINEVLFTITGESPVENAFVDRDGNWFLAEDFLLPCEGPFAPDDLAATVAGWEEASADTVDIVLAIAPDKSAIENASFGTRTRFAAGCQIAREDALQAAFSTTGDLLDLWTPLRERARSQPTTDTYFVNDSHWTSWGALSLSEEIVDGFAPGLFDESEVETIDTFTVTGDVTRRLGWERDEESPRLSSVRPETVTDLTIEPAGGPQGVRVYRTSASTSAGVVPGTTLIVHDSMGNYAEGVLAPYFEHVEFIHWNDLSSAGFLDRAATADNIVFEVVQRDLSARSTRPFADPQFDRDLREAIAPG